MPEELPGQIIDAHHHLWHYAPDEYPWMTENMAALRRDYLLSDLTEVTQAASVTGTVAVQARQSVVETEWLAQIAAGSDLIRGVVGWVPLTDSKVATLLESLASLPKVKAMRHVLHDERNDFYMLRPDFNRGVSYLKEFGLVYDLLIFERHLPQTIRFLDNHPDQRFVLDHIGKPQIRNKRISPWRENLRELALRPTVYCKVSGMVTEAAWESWTEDDLSIYFEIVLDAFGPARVMFGSDWPVATLASSYGQWLHCVRKAIAGLSPDEQHRILYGTAVEAYDLDKA